MRSDNGSAGQLPHSWRYRIAWALLFVAYFAYLLLMSFYHKSTTDEGLYFYESTRIAEGLLPVRDFFAPHPIGAYAPYALFIKLLSPSLEAARLFSVVALLAIAGMLSLLLYRAFGHRYAVLGFILLATNQMWLFFNIQVRHSAPATLGLFTAFFLLTIGKRLQFWQIFLGGVFFGLAANSRIPLILVGIPLLWIILGRHLNDLSPIENRGAQLALKVFAFFGGILLASSLSLYLLIGDPRGFFFNILGHRLSEGRYTGEGTYSLSDIIIQGRILPFWRFASWDSQILLIVLLPVVLLLVVLGFSLTRYSRTKVNVLGTNARYALAMIAAIVVAYAVGDDFNPRYLHHTIPFFIFVLAALVSGITSVIVVERSVGVYLRSVTLKLGSKYLAIPLLIIVALSAGSGLSYGASQVVNRETTPSLKSVLSQVKVGCWLEANTDASDVVLSWTGLPVGMADRTLPKGFEQFYFGWALWDNISDRDAASFGIVTRNEIKRQLQQTAIAVVLDDNRMADLAVDHGFVEYRPLLESRYVYYGTLSEQRIYVSPTLVRSRSLSLLPADAVPVPYRTRRAVSALRALPTDLAHSMARLIGLDYQSRCGSVILPPVLDDVGYLDHMSRVMSNR